MYKFIDLDTGLPALLNKIKAYVDTAIAALVNGAPAALDTLKELADALGDDSDAISALTNAIAAKANSADLPTKVSDLTNDSGFITASEVSGIVAGSGDIVITETSSYIDIFIYGAEIGISPNMLSLYAAQKSATITVSGSHLKSDINISVPTGFTASPSTISHVNGTVADTNVTITYTGADASTASGNITATAGDVVKSIPVAYSQYQGPTIIADSTLTVKAAAGSSNTGTLSVMGVNLEGNISAAISGTDASKFSVSPASISQSGGTASGTFTITYSPAANDNGASATLTLSSTGATSKVVALAGAIAGSLSISPATASIGIASGGSGTAVFTVIGAHLTPATTASIEVSGAGMSADKQTLTVGQDGTINEVVTVTFSGSADSNGTLTVSHADVDTAATAAVVGSVVSPLPADAAFKVNGIFYKVNSDQTSVSVWNGTSTSSEASSANKYKNAITIPASVSDSGVTATLSDSTTQAGAGFTYAVTKLAGHAFHGCSGLTSLTLPEGLLEIGLHSLSGLTNNSMTTLTIPSTVTSIAGSFLNGCTKLTTVNMLCATNPNFIDSWGINYNPQLKTCSALTSFVQPDNITVNRSENYQGCSAMQSFTIGKSCTVINRMFSTNYMPNVTEIICRGTTTIPKINASSSTTFSIASTVFANATLKVPRGYKQAYLDAVDGRSGTTLWSGFATIEEYDLTD